MLNKNKNTPKQKTKKETVEDYGLSVDSFEDEVNTTEVTDLDTVSLDTNKLDNLAECYLANKGPLYVPETVHQRFAEKGYVVYWINVYLSNGDLNGKLIRQKEMQGYSFVAPEEVPEMSTQMSSFFKEELNKHQGLIVMGDAALAKLPIQIQTARKQLNERTTRERSQGIIKDIRNANIRGEFKTTRSTNGEGRDVDFS